VIAYALEPCTDSVFWSGRARLCPYWIGPSEICPTCPADSIDVGAALVLFKELTMVAG